MGAFLMTDSLEELFGRVPPSSRRIVREFVEHMGADCVVVMWTVTEASVPQTARFFRSWGNTLAIRRMIEDTYFDMDDDEGDEDGASEEQGE